MSKEAFQTMVDQADWDNLLRKGKFQKGDFTYVPSGTIHAIGKGIVILGTQQNSDITYRVYDYDRKDVKGSTRELHIESSVEVTNYPHHVEQQEIVKKTIGDLIRYRLVKEAHFTVFHWKLDGETYTPLNHDFILVSVIAGQGKVNIDEHEFAIKKGDNFILPASVKNYKQKGVMEMIVSHM